MSDGPKEPMTPVGEAMAGLREMYESLRAAGFTMIEACTIVATCIAQAGAAKNDE